MTPTFRGLLGLAAIVAAAPIAGAQTNASAAPSARPANVASINAIVHAAYDAISGPVGTRDWDRFYSLFAPNARLIPTHHDSTGGAHLSAMTPREFATSAQSYFAKNGFYEGEIGQTADTYGAIAQVFSAYASRHAADDPKPFARGINSFQLFNDGKRWYIVTIYWDDEHSGETIPSRYLHTGQ